MVLEARGTVTIKGQTVDVQALSDLKLKGVTSNLEGTSTLTAKGATTSVEATRHHERQGRHRDVQGSAVTELKGGSCASTRSRGSRRRTAREPNAAGNGRVEDETMPPAATMGDKVVGSDIHIIVIPAAGGPVPTPLPHPYSGRILGNCVPTVLIGGKPAATIGSTVTNIPPAHPARAGPSRSPRPIRPDHPDRQSATVLIGGKPAAAPNRP